MQLVQCSRISKGNAGPELMGGPEVSCAHEVSMSCAARHDKRAKGSRRVNSRRYATAETCSISGLSVSCQCHVSIGVQVIRLPLQT